MMRRMMTDEDVGLTMRMLRVMMRMKRAMRSLLSSGLLCARVITSGRKCGAAPVTNCSISCIIVQLYNIQLYNIQLYNIHCITYNCIIRFDSTVQFYLLYNAPVFNWTV